MNRREFLKSAAAVVAFGVTGGLMGQSRMGSGDGANKTDGQITRRRYKNSDLTLPLLGFGTMRLPQKNGKIDVEAGKLLIDRAMAAGLNYFDTAWPYHDGESETFVGNALRKYPRESYILADKLPIWSIKSVSDADRIFHEQLKKCRTDYFDFYLLHALNRSSWETVKRCNLFEFAEQMRGEGKIRKIGFSFHDTPDVLKEIAAAKPWDFALLQINYMDWYNYHSKEQYEIVTGHGIPILVMEPLRGGALARLNPQAIQILKTANPEASTASWAFRYAASLPNVLCVLSGMNLMEHLEDNIRTFTPFNPLTDSERLTLNSALAAYRLTDSIPCTACRYCVPCPAGVMIPEIFGLYNQSKLSGDTVEFQRAVAALPEDGGPDACVDCEACLRKCPQHINIPSELRKVLAAAK